MTNEIRFYKSARIKINILTVMKSPEKKTRLEETVSQAGEFDSSDEEDGEIDDTPLLITWLDLTKYGFAQKLGVCALPGCRFKDTHRSIEKDIKQFQEEGVKDLFCLCSKGELTKYRCPHLLEKLVDAEVTVHHYPFPDGEVMSISEIAKLLEELQNRLGENKTLIHCFGGLGRSCLVAVCLMLKLDIALTPDNAIENIRKARSPRAIQSVKQYNFIHDFRDLLEKYTSETEELQRSLSR